MKTRFWWIEFRRRYAVAGIVLGMIASALVWSMRGKDRTGSESPTVHMADSDVDVRRVFDLARPHLDWASSECQNRAADSLALLHAVFDEKRKQVPAFVDVALGLESKLTLVSDQLQGTSKHAEFLRSQFESLIISEQQLLSVMHDGMHEFQKSISDVESLLLVRLHTDRVDIEQNRIAAGPESSHLVTSFHEAIRRAGTATQVDLQATIGRELISFIVGEMATQIAVKLGISSGVLSIGGLSGTGTFGVGLIVGVAVDYVACAAYDAWADPKGQLTRQIVSQLELMETAIINGVENQPGFRQQLEQYSAHRTSVREAIVLELLKEGAI